MQNSTLAEYWLLKAREHPHYQSLIGEREATMREEEAERER